LLRKAFFPRRPEPFLTKKTVFLSRSEPFLTLLKTPYSFQNCMVVRLLNHIPQNGALAAY
jgi:hypothetical protein